MDAVSFVLGSRATDLRGRELRDLIYHPGIPETQPSPKVRSYVKLVFVPGPGEEPITFQRSIVVKPRKQKGPRKEDKGEGEEGEDEEDDDTQTVSKYAINEKEVKWTEYYDKLLQYNLDARHCMVYQGDVESIVSKSGQSLTRLLEIVSGSDALASDYQRAQSEVHKAEDSVVFNWQKRRGLVAEKKQYKQQKIEAEKYYKLKAEERTIKGRHALFQIYYINRDIEQWSKELVALQENLEKIQKKKEVVETRINEYKKEQATQQQNATKQQRLIAKKQQEIDKIRPNLIKAQEARSHIAQRLENNRALLEKYKEDASRSEAKIKTLESELKEVDRAEKEWEADFKKQQQAMTVTLSDEQWEEFNRRKGEAGTNTAGIRQQLAIIERTQTLDKEERARLENKLQELQTQKQRLTEEHTQLLARAEKIREAMKQTETSVSNLEKELAEIKSANEDARRQQKELNEELENLQQRLQEAKVDLLESDRSKRSAELAQNLQRLFQGRGVYGRVIDVIHPIDRSFQLAVSVVLAPHADSIIVQEERVAMDCIRYIREQRLGTATFLPLDSLLTAPAPDRLRALDSRVRPLIDVLKFDVNFTRAAEYVAGHTLLADTLDVAKEFAFGQRTGERYKVVTKDGTLIHKSGLMTGGFTAETEAAAKRWSEREVAELKRKRDACLNKLAEIGQSLRSFAKEEQLKAQLTTLQSRLKYTKVDLDATESRMQKNDEELEAINKEIKKLENQIRQLTRAIESREDNIEKLRADIRKIEDQIFGSFSRQVGVPNILEYEERRLRLAKEASEKRLLYATQRSRIASLLEYERQRDFKGTIERLEKSIKEDEDELRNNEKEFKEWSEKMSALTTELEKMQKTADEQMKKIQDIETQIKALRKEADTAVRTLNTTSRALLVIETSLEQARLKRHNLYKNARLETLEAEIDAKPLEGEEFVLIPLKPDSAPLPTIDQKDSEDPTELRQILLNEDNIRPDFKKLTKEDKKLSPQQREERHNWYLDQLRKIASEIAKIEPNLKAMERLQNIEQKLEESNKLLESARAEHAEAKKRFFEIRDERIRLFKKAFDHVSQHIDAIYKELTNEMGNAYLSVDNQDEPYLGAVRYSAVPPSKGFRDIEQLSGGEKAVAALALLFAIHSYKPSPFFVLDEVDAALDLNNVQIVAQYIRKKSRAIQFLIISLKDRFYDKADALIGIYKDQGLASSRTLTLDLSKYE
jgi:structural maintenance of chromosome 1